MTPPTKLVLSAVMVIAFTAMTAYADVIQVTGSTQGTFDGGPTSIHPTIGNLLTALEFQGQNFSTSVTTGSPAVPVTVGSFDLRTLRNFDFTGHTFNLVVNFTAPPGAPGGPQTFTATLSGMITVINGGEAIAIDFNNIPQVFGYNGGIFSFSVNDIPILNEQSAFVDLTANVSATATPEPLSMLLLGSGLAGLGVKLRKRRSS